MHETKLYKISYLNGSSSVDTIDKPKAFQKAAVARLLGLFSTQKWILLCISQCSMLADVRSVELDNEDRRGGVCHCDNENDNVLFDIITCTESGLIIGTIVKWGVN